MRLWPMYLTLVLLAALVVLEYRVAGLSLESAERERRAETPFMTVDDLSYSDGYVTTYRTINLSALEFPEGIVADWSVTIVRDNRKPPSCQTQPGPQINEGWSIYDQFEPTRQSMPLDIWVGQEGCWDSLESGATYHMHVVWTPRNTTLRLARASMTFVPDKS